MKVFLETTVAEFKCSARNLDESLLVEYFIKNHCSVVDNPEDADVIVINTCAAYKKCVDYSIKAAKEKKKLNKTLIVCGCLPSINPKLLKEQLGEGIFSFSPKNMEAIDTAFPDFEFKLRNIKDANDIKYADKIDKESVFVRIERGCLGNCSYCAIKEAVGRLKSKTVENIEDEFKSLIRAHKRIVLVGEDVGAYGVDIGKTLPGLVRRLIVLSNQDTVIHLPELNSSWFIRYKDELIDIFRNKHIEKIFGVSLQSGSKRILKLMKRNTEVEKVKKTLMEFRNEFPDIILKSCFIMGFPTETNEDFKQSLSIMQKRYFDYIGIFKYYETENMSSCQIEPKVDRAIIEERSQIAADSSTKNRIQFRVG